MIRCRLDAGSSALATLCDRIRQRDSYEGTSGSFYIFLGDGSEKEQELKATSGAPESDETNDYLLESGIFKFETQFSVPSVNTPIHIFHVNNHGDRSLISGFPCTLEQLQKLSKILLPRCTSQKF
jgi:hypothetical protein